MNKEYIVGIDIGGTNFRIGAVNLSGEIFDIKVMRSNFLSSGGDAVITLAKNVEEYISCFEGTVLGVSVGIPGSISKDKKWSYSVPNITDKDGKHVFDNRNIVNEMQNLLNIPVFINKDVNNLLEYDMIIHDLRGEKVIVGCYIGTGFGGSICMNGKFLHGKNGVANEIGHIPFFKSQLVCSCGKRACAECYASGKALSILREEHYPETHIGDLFTEHGRDVRIIDFVEACALPIATEINIFDPDCVIIGGGVINMNHFPRERLIEFILENTRKPYPAENIKILFSKQCDNMGVVGAAVYAMDEMNIEFTNRMAENIKEYTKIKETQ